MDKAMIIKPRISEKAYGLSQTANVYVFEVPADANKLSVADAVAAQFEVTVTDVNIANAKGKTKQQYRKRGRRTTGKKPDIKKAYVSLKEGDKIAIFANEEDEKPKSKAKEKK
jgi:large subunit ribosomal protein L23